MSERLLSAAGLITMLILAWAMSSNKKQMPWRIIIVGVLMQWMFALFILKTSWGSLIFSGAQDAVATIVGLSDKGAIFLFGPNFADHFFAFKVLPTIIFVSALSALLFHWGILQRVVSALAALMQRGLGISGAESLVSAANIFLGQTEAPLLVKPYIAGMTRSEIMVMMSSGMASVAGGVLAAYVGMGISAGHLLAASVMSAPASIVIARMMVPETQTSQSLGRTQLELIRTDANSFAAACRGASEGLMLALNVGAMLIAFVALVGLANLLLSKISEIFFTAPLSFEILLGYFFYPFALLMGVPSKDCLPFAQLIGERMVLNEFVAYLHLGEMVKAGTLSERSVSIATYALCGFANFSSIAIQIGGIGAIVSERRGDFARLGLRSMVAGTLACFMTACIAGILL